MSDQAAPDGSDAHHTHEMLADHRLPRTTPRDTLLSNDSDDEGDEEHSPSTPGRDSSPEEMRRLTEATWKVSLNIVVPTLTVTDLVMSDQCYLPCFYSYRRPLVQVCMKGCIDLQVRQCQVPRT